MELWDELGQGRRARGGGDTTVKRRLEAVGKLAALGRPGKAIHRLISPGLASNTRRIEEKLKSKFPIAQRPRDLRGPVPPPANMVEAEKIVEVIRSLADSGAGPTGLRPQFLKEMVGDDIEDPVVGIFVAFLQLFIDGDAPTYLRQMVWRRPAT